MGRFIGNRRDTVEANRELAAQDDGAPPLPPRLPRPEYALIGNTICPDGLELDFFVACTDGDLALAEHIINELHPGQAVLQYGLETAAWAGQLPVVQHLLQNGAVLHSAIFERSLEGDHEYECIFDRPDALPLIRVLLCHGWHPNQAWEHPMRNVPRTPLVIRTCLEQKSLVMVLLEHGADPNLGPHAATYGHGIVPIKRKSGESLNLAVRLWDTVLIDMLLQHGASATNAHMLHSVASYMGPDRDLFRGAETVSFAARRAVAEHILASGSVGVNDIKAVAVKHLISRPPGITTLTTPFAYACAAQDWEFAGWLLEHGADPNLLDGMAMKPQWWMEPYLGPSDPKHVIELIQRVPKIRLEARMNK